MSDNPLKRKRPKKYYVNHKKGKFEEFGPNQSGFLITCNGDDRGALHEGYRFLNQVADARYGAEELAKEEGVDGTDEEEDEDDIEKSIKKEVKDIKAASKAVRRFQNLSTKAKSVIFIRSHLEDQLALVDDVFTGVEEGRIANIRNCQRLLPVLTTCYAKTEEIIKCGTKLIPTYFQTEPDMKPLKFCLVWKVSCNKQLSRDDVILPLCKIIEETGIEHVTDYKEPELVLNIETIGNTTVFSILRNYVRFRKFNLQSVLALNSSSTKLVDEKSVNELQAVVPSNSNLTATDDSKTVTNVKANELGNSVTIAVGDEVKGSNGSVETAKEIELHNSTPVVGKPDELSDLNVTEDNSKTAVDSVVEVVT